MASLKEIKTRIASVNSTRKITSAMKMVASSKLHHAQVAIQNMLPYENLLEHILKSFLVSTPEATSLFEQRHNVWPSWSIRATVLSAVASMPTCSR